MNILAIVGRPNVGKSTLFNRIVGKAVSIVENTPGVTRDRIYAAADWAGKTFSVIDTGGIDIKNINEMQRHITTQARIAVDLATVVLFVVDGKDGITQGDHDAAEILRKSKKPVIVAVNKLDNDKMETESGYDFYNLGFKNMHFISASLGRGIGDMLDEICVHFSEDENFVAVNSNDSENEKQEAVNETNIKTNLKIAVVGKPNAGKSSLINKLLGETRLVVSEVAGTTRDSVDAEIKFKGRIITLVDTAGIRRKSKIEDESLEDYSVLRSLEAIRRCDVAFVVVDSSENISEQDLKIASFVDSLGKPSIIIMNKWDVIKKDTHTINEFNALLGRELAFMGYFKSIYISAKTGQRVGELLNAACEVFERACTRIKTGTLNELMHEAFRLAPPPNVKGVNLKLFYATQAGILPPTFVLFVNNAAAVQNSYLRYLENFLRKTVDLTGVPIKIVLKNRIRGE